MTEGAEPNRRWSVPGAAALVLAALAATMFNLNDQLSISAWWGTIASASPTRLDQVVFLYSLMPRLTMSLVCGAALGVSGITLQQILQNPLAEPTTLGVSGGAQLALTIATIWFPSLLVFGTEAVALTGAGVATLLAVALAFDDRLSSIRLILSGLTISLYAETLISVTAVLHGEDMGAIFLWSSGILSQNGWHDVRGLLPQVAICMLAIFFLVRPLSIVSLGDERAVGLGVPIFLIRLMALIPAIALGALVVSVVGVIAFIGVGAPAFARGLGIRRPAALIIGSAATGATLLWGADQFVLILAKFGWTIPTGVASALIGAPSMIWLLARQHGEAPVVSPLRPERAAGRDITLVAILGLLLLAIVIALFVSRSPIGWAFDGFDVLQLVWDLRWPRIVAAGSTGAMLALSGFVMQRVTANPMASPEIMGTSSAAAFGAILFLTSSSEPTQIGMTIAAAAAAALAFFLVIALTLRSGISPELMLLVGVSISSCTSALTAFLLTGANPRIAQALSLLSGSTYRVSGYQACAVLGTILVLGATLMRLGRWLTVLPLGRTVSIELGIPLRGARLLLIALTALLTACATLVVGPLSFVGLLAPHLVQRLGFAGPKQQMIAVGTIGALILIMSDWLGRNLLFPSQIPAGLLGSLIGGPYLLFTIYREKRR